jgi:hypothetical protein
VAELADRIEAAWKRDKSDAIKTAMMCKCEVCRDVQENKAALRQELETLVGRMESFAADCGDETLAMNIRLYGRGIRRVLSNAAPARNCDRFATAYEAIKAWDGGLDTAEDIVRMITWLLGKAEGGAE